MTKYKVIIYKHTVLENVHKSVNFHAHYTNNLRPVFNKVKKLREMNRSIGRVCNYTVKVEKIE